VGASVVAPLERTIEVRCGVVGFSNRVWNGVIPVKLFYGAHALGKRAITVHLPDGLRR
jgi:hypothetical protein